MHNLKKNYSVPPWCPFETVSFSHLDYIFDNVMASKYTKKIVLTKFPFQRPSMVPVETMPDGTPVEQDTNALIALKDKVTNKIS